MEIIIVIKLKFFQVSNTLIYELGKCFKKYKTVKIYFFKLFKYRKMFNS